MNTILHQGHNAEVLRQYPDCHFDAIVTDPPYGIEFLGKDWDSHTGAIETWQQCLRVLKPGGHLLAFSAARTYHHLATNIESVGFEIRDQLMWIYSSGFPKAQDIGKALDKRGITNQSHGWKTALKPAHEPIVMARKPMKGSTIDNVIQHGVGALNIDSSRIPYENQQDLNTYINNIAGPLERSTASAGDTIQMHEGRTGFKVQRGVVKRPTDNLEGMRRFTGSDSNTFARINPEDRDSKDRKRVIRAGRDPRNRLKDLESQTTPADHNHEETPVYEANPQGRYPSNVMGDIPDYQKYFYCPKVSRKERHTGFNDLPKRLCGPGGKEFVQSQDHQRSNKNTGNNHPTVKPVALMRYLIEMVTHKNSTVLDPFMGSGSTGMAARELGHRFVGIDLDPNYVAIAEQRIQGWIKPKESCHSTFNKLFD